MLASGIEGDDTSCVDNNAAGAQHCAVCSTSQKPWCPQWRLNQLPAGQFAGGNEHPDMEPARVPLQASPASCTCRRIPVNDCNVQSQALHHVDPKVAELAIAECHNLVAWRKSVGQRCFPSTCRQQSSIRPGLLVLGRPPLLSYQMTGHDRTLQQLPVFRLARGHCYPAAPCSQHHLQVLCM